MVVTLMDKANAKALIMDSHFTNACSNVSIPRLIAVSEDTLLRWGTTEESLGDLPAVLDHDVAIIFHSSGTTSGVPKIIPHDHLWMKTITNRPLLTRTASGSDRLVMNIMGNLAHPGSLCCA
jgi:acyl-coenzyme A synthetase/AMP-(fatty) acid ligase